MYNLARIQTSADMNDGTEYDFSSDDSPSVRISFPNNEDGIPQIYQCIHCGAEVRRANDSDPWVDDYDEWLCPENDNDPGLVDSERVHAIDVESANTDVSRWLNSARISINERGDELNVVISVGDPRGGFRLTVRRMGDGRLIMHVPHPGESLPHAKLTELHPGTYEIG